MKFEVGDKVKILDGSNIKDYTGHWVTGMSDYIGKVVTIQKRIPFSSSRIGYRLKEYGYTWDGRGLERWDGRGLEMDEYETVVIERHRDKIIAKRGKVVGAATFHGNYSQAAISALESLIRKEKVRKFHKGDLVRYVKECGFVEVGMVGKIVEIDKSDTAMPFFVKFDNDGTYWLEADDIDCIF